MYDLVIAKGTRVEVAAPQGSVYDGKRGTVQHVTDTTAFVKLDGIAIIPFGLVEMVPLAGGLLKLDLPR